MARLCGVALPRRTGRIADDQQSVILDGTFAETKEALGGVIGVGRAAEHLPFLQSCRCARNELRQER
jgi:hypothetical protein